MRVFIHFDFLTYWSVTPSKLNIKEQMAHCLLWVKLGLDKVYIRLYARTAWKIPMTGRYKILFPEICKI